MATDARLVTQKWRLNALEQGAKAQLRATLRGLMNTRTEMTTAEPKTNIQSDARALLKDLHTRFEIFRNHSPLAIGIDKQVLAVLPDLEKKALRLAMRSHTISTRYLKEMEKATVRLNLDATPAGEVTDENRTHAAEQLRERFKKQAEQRKAVEVANKAAEEAAKAEQLRLEKLSQLADKFSRKPR